MYLDMIYQKNPKTNYSEKRLNCKLQEQIFMPEIFLKKSQQPQSSRLRSQPRKDYKLLLHNLKD